MIPFFLPIEKAVHDSWREGKVPLMLPEVSFGRPLAANPNTGAFYPVRIAMAALPFPLSFKLFPVFHLWLAGVGAFFLARLFGISSLSAMLTGALYAGSGPALSEIVFPNILPGLALLPWIVWAGARFGARQTGRSAALFGAIWGVDLLVGDVFTAGLAFVGAILFVLQESRGTERPRRVGALFLASLPGFLLAGDPERSGAPVRPLHGPRARPISAARGGDLVRVAVASPGDDPALSVRKCRFVPARVGGIALEQQDRGFFPDLLPGCLRGGGAAVLPPSPRPTAVRVRHSGDFLRRLGARFVSAGKLAFGILADSAPISGKAHGRGDARDCPPGRTRVRLASIGKADSGRGRNVCGRARSWPRRASSRRRDRPGSPRSSIGTGPRLSGMAPPAPASSRGC